MKLQNWFNKWNLESVKLNAKFLEAEISFNDVDRQAAWELYIELLTRISTQPMHFNSGDDLTALNSLYSIFSTTRDILKSAGPKAISFSKIAIPVLNQILRPFTSKWHKIFLDNNNVLSSELKIKFREQLLNLQSDINNVMKVLSEISQVEDLSSYEQL